MEYKQTDKIQTEQLQSDTARKRRKMPRFLANTIPRLSPVF